jgi:hypothetical protein
MEIGRRHGVCVYIVAPQAAQMLQYRSAVDFVEGNAVSQFMVQIKVTITQQVHIVDPNVGFQHTDVIHAGKSIPGVKVSPFVVYR